MKTLYTFLLLSMILFSCNKDTTGPTGATGPQGPTGPSGPGNITDSVYTVASNEWALVANTSYEYTGKFSVPAITQDAYDNGVVNVYYYSPGGFELGLPYSNGQYEEGYTVFVGAIQIEFTTSVENTPGTFSYKVAVISPDMLIAHPSTNFNNIPFSRLQKVLSTAELQKALSDKSF